MFCTVLMAEVVGEVEASLFLSFMMGLEECLSLLQVGLLGMSDSQEQLGEQGGSYLQHQISHHNITTSSSEISYPAFSPARLRAVSLSEVVSAVPSMLSSLKG